jgi:hypothetical protein
VNDLGGTAAGGAQRDDISRQPRPAQRRTGHVGSRIKPWGFVRPGLLGASERRPWREDGRAAGQSDDVFALPSAMLERPGFDGQ